MFRKIKFFFSLRIHRNYKKTIKNNDLFRIRKLKSDLAEYKLVDIEKKYSNEFEISVRQFLFQKLFGQLFLKQLFFFLDKRIILFPIPKQWNKVFKENFFYVSKISNYLFRMFLLLQIYKGIFFFIKVLIEYIFNKKKIVNKKNDVVVHNLSNYNLK